VFYIIKAKTVFFSEENIQELFLKLNDTIKSSDKNVCTRALWVISKQTFPTEVVGKVVSIVFVCVGICQ
jgi:telomere-associated protein RIF1